jgi:uncharacterized membrane protein YraQ (UPF0718 family)
VSKSGKPLVSPKDLIALAVVVCAYAGLILLFPDTAPRAIETSRRFFLEMIGVLPAVVVLMGLFAVFVSNDFVVRHLGRESGLKGFILSVFMGTLPTGPLYVAFPLVRAMLKKGAGVANMIAFLTAYACIKLPQELLELRFLGPEFTAARLALTVMAAGVMGVIAARIMDWGEGSRFTEARE